MPICGQLNRDQMAAQLRLFLLLLYVFFLLCVSTILANKDNYFLFVNTSYILTCTVFKLPCSIGEISAFDGAYLFLTQSFSVISENITTYQS